MSDDGLLRLGLVNHAMAVGLGTDEAWRLVDRLVEAHPGAPVRELAELVREAATDVVFPV